MREEGLGKERRKARKTPVSENSAVSADSRGPDGRVRQVHRAENADRENGDVSV